MTIRHRLARPPFRRFSVVLLPLMFQAACLTGPDDRVAAGILVLAGATLIDGTGDPPRTASVVVEEGRITWVGPPSDAEVPEGASVVDLRGRWLLPGFIDVHAHMPLTRDDQADALGTLLAFGVTTARTPAAGTPEAGVRLRERLASGEVVGPRVLSAGWLINSVGSGFGTEVGSVAEVRAVVRAQIRDGVDYVKLYVGLRPELVEAAVDEAHAGGVEVIGHLGRTTWAEAAGLGIDHLTHSAIFGLAHSLVPPGEREEFRNFFSPNSAFDPALFGRWRDVVDLSGETTGTLISTLESRGVSVDPNLVLAEAVLFGDEPAVLTRLEPRYARAGQRAAWGVPHPYSATWTASEYAQAKASFPHFLEAVRRLHDGGVLLAAGSDLENPWMTPGVSFHRELQLLVQAGISPMDVLEIATRQGAEALGLGGVTGTVAVGRDADFVVLTADPLADISNTRSIEHVVLRGRMLEPSELVGR